VNRKLVDYETSILGYLHLLSLFFRTGLLSRDGAGAVVKSSKFIMINDMSSTSLRIGAITSEHRNFEPKIKEILIRTVNSRNFSCKSINRLKCVLMWYLSGNRLVTILLQTTRLCLMKNQTIRRCSVPRNTSSVKNFLN